MAWAVNWKPASSARSTHSRSSSGGTTHVPRLPESANGSESFAVPEPMEPSVNDLIAPARTNSLPAFETSPASATASR